MKKNLNTLAACPLFAGVKTEDLPAIMQTLDAQFLCVNKKQVIFHEGDPARYVGVVLSGRIQVVRDAICGTRSIIADVGPTQIFGASFAFAGVSAMPASVIAALSSEVLLIDAGRFLTTGAKLRAYHAILMGNLLRLIAAQSVRFNEKLEIVTQRTTRDKLLAFLYNQARIHGSNRFTLSYNRQNMADYLGVSRCAMVTELTRMKREGLIDFDKNEFTLPVAAESGSPTR